MPNIPQYAHSFIVEAAALAKHGDQAALDFLIAHCACVIGSADRHDLVKIFNAYNDRLSEAADRVDAKRSAQVKVEMDLCSRAARNGEAYAILKIRRYLLDLTLKAPYSIWLSFNGLSLKELPPRDERSVVLLPSLE